MPDIKGLTFTLETIVSLEFINPINNTMKNEKGILIAKIKFKKPITVRNGDHLKMNFSINPEREEGELISIEKIEESNK